MTLDINIDRMGGSEKPHALYFLRLTLIALVPAQLIHDFLENYGLFVEQLPPSRVLTARRIIVGYVDLILLTPWIETLLMVVLFFVLRACRIPRPMLLWVSALVWAAIHSYTHQPGYGVMIFWPFVILSALFLKFDATSRNRAVVYTAIVHSMYNILATVLFSWDIFGLHQK